MLRLILSFLILFPGLSAQGAVILKKKNRQALLHLEGLKTKPGAFFKVLDWRGNSRGLMQIKRLSKNKKKAIGVLKTGKMAKNWALEPVSHRVAERKLKRLKGKKLALLKKRRSMRRLANVRAKKRRELVRSVKRKQRRIPSRYLSNVNEDIQEEANYEQETQNEQYMIDEKSVSPPQEDYYNPDFLKKVSTEADSSDSDLNLTVGASVSPSFSFMKLQYRDIELMPTGMGFDGQVFVEGTMNDSIRWNAHTGYRTFSARVQDSLCNRKECFLSMNYLIGGAGLKFNLVDKNSFTLWGGLWSDMMFLLGYDNEIVISHRDEGDITLNKDSFMLHGVIGFSLGADIQAGKKLTIPLALEGYLFMPPTATVTAGSVSLRLGLGWKL